MNFPGKFLDFFHTSTISQGPVEADLTLGSCNHLTDANLILPTLDKIEKSFSQKDEQNDNLCELVVDKETNVGVDKESTETSMNPMKDADKSVPDMGLDAMATAVSLRCLTALPSSSTTTESNARSSLDDLVHAANRFVPWIHVSHALLLADSVRCCILLYSLQYFFDLFSIIFF